MQQPMRAAGIAWYRRENYARVLAVMADAHVLPRRFDEWLEQAQRAEQRFVAQGWVVHRIDLDPNEFLAWCTRHNIDADAKARMIWGNAGAARKHGQES